MEMISRLTQRLPAVNNGLLVMLILFLWLVYHGHACVLCTTEQIPFTRATLVAINLIDITM